MPRVANWKKLDFSMKNAFESLASDEEECTEDIVADSYSAANGLACNPGATLSRAAGHIASAANGHTCDSEATSLSSTAGRKYNSGATSLSAMAKENSVAAKECSESIMLAKMLDFVQEDKTETVLEFVQEMYKKFGEVQNVPKVQNAPKEENKDEPRPLLQMLDQVRNQVQTLNALGGETNFEGKWERIRAIMDSGATVPVMSPNTGRHYKSAESVGSKAGVMYACANGDTIPNLGEKTLPVVTREGTVHGYISQLADVTTSLQSVRHLHKSGHVVIFDGPNSFMYNKHTGEANMIEDDGFNYIQELWVIPPEELGNDSGFAGQHP